MNEDVERVLKIAKEEIGVKEEPADSNNVKYNTWYYGHHVYGKNYPWCMAFCQWVFKQAGVKLPILTASCGTMLNEAKKVSRYTDKLAEMKPGDLVLFRFTKNGPTTHCGIIESVGLNSIYSIEGNTSVSDDQNGGCVMRRKRSFSNIYGIVQPYYYKGVEDMTADQFIASLTDEQAYKLLEKAQRHSAKQPVPAWAKADWREAEEKKIINGEPERFIKRDEVITILKRCGSL